MGGGSAAVSAGVDLRAVRDQPGNRPVIPLVGERLQLSAFAAAWAVNGYAPVEECFGDVVCRSAVTLKVAKRNREMRHVSAHTVVQQPEDQSEVLRRPARAEQRCRLADPPIG